MSGATPKTVDLDRTREAMGQVGLEHAAGQLGEVVSETVKSNWAPHVFLERLLTAELQHREERRIKTSLRLSGLPTGYTLAGFDYVQRVVMWTFPALNEAP